MECSRCAVAPLVHSFTAANLDKSLGRLKSERIHNAVHILQEAMRKVCADCGSRSMQISRAIGKVKSAWNENYRELFKTIKSVDAEKIRLVEELQSAFQAVCLTCSRDSNDDNPSNHGQTFVSMDSGNCSSNSGRAATSATDDNVVLSRADWIGSHAAADYSHTLYGVDPSDALQRKENPKEAEAADNDQTSLLPSDVEDVLRKEFSNFAALDIIDKILLACVVSGMNIAEFAKMLWLPYSIVNPQDNTIHPITKQAAHARWQNIITKFPVFSSVAISQIARFKSRASAAKWISNPNADKPSNRFANGKLTPEAKKAAAKSIPKVRISHSSDDSTASVSSTTKQTRRRHRKNLNGDSQPDLLGENWSTFDSSDGE